MAEIVNGKFLRMKIGGTVISAETGFSFNYSAEEVEASNKDGDFVISGRKVGSISISAHWDEDAAATNQWFDVLADLKAGTSVAWVFGGATTGDKTLSGNGVFTETSFDAQNGQAVAWTATLSVSGDVTEGTVA